jgi:hypothetical protein
MAYIRKEAQDYQEWISAISQEILHQRYFSKKNLSKQGKQKETKYFPVLCAT